jgi:2-polyprenyl-6-methoxyphenol hydroxylase-like FAD-dependent oxidoreductase
MSLARPGRRPITINAADLLAGVADRHIEIMRGDLAQILYDGTKADVEYLFGTTVTALADSGDDGVAVTLSNGRTASFDLVIGADGMHSGVRRLVFGEESRYRRFLGGYLAVYTVPDFLGLDGAVLGHHEVDRAVAVYPTRDPSRARVVFLLRSHAELDHDHRDAAAQRMLLRSLVGDLGWEVPRLLDHLDAAGDFYFDSISQIHLDSWSQGRVTLVGDAGYGPGPAVGGGSSLALIGAYVLATELAAAGGDHRAAFPAYERAMTATVCHSRRIGPAVLSTLIPGSRLQLWTTAQALRVLPHLPKALQRKLTSFGGSPAAMLNDIELRPTPDVVRLD